MYTKLWGSRKMRSWPTSKDEAGVWNIIPGTGNGIMLQKNDKMAYTSEYL
jgi:hypothetical protein